MSKKLNDKIFQTQKGKKKNERKIKKKLIIDIFIIKNYLFVIFKLMEFSLRFWLYRVT